MKKYLIVLAAAVMALASCSNGGGGSKYTSIKFKNAEMTMALGATDKLQVLYEPTSLDAPVCVWASSNEDVVSVDQQGNIEALEEGVANITATYGEGEEALKAVCKITVEDGRAMLEWGGVSRFSDVTFFDETIYDVPLSDGVYKCKYGFATYYFWDNGIFINDNNYLDGEGYLFMIDSVPTYIIAEGEWAGYGVGHPIYFLDEEFNPADTANLGCVKAGALGDVNDLAAYILETDSTKTYEDCFFGPALVVLYDGNFYYPSFGAILNKGYIYGNYQTMGVYNFSATWADGYYGLAIDETGEALKEPYEWDVVTFPYLLSNASDAPRHISPKAVAKSGRRAFNMPMKAFQTKEMLIKK